MLEGGITCGGFGFFHRTPGGEPIWLDAYKYAILREEFFSR
jgi:hypothetical protein